MSPRWVRIGRVVATFAVVGWLAGSMVLATDASRSGFRAMLHLDAFKSSLSALLAAVVWAPLLSAQRVRWWAGAIFGVAAALTGIYLFFWFWPHSWQPTRWDAYKSVGLFVGVYGKVLVPMGAAGGAFAAFWSSQPVRRPRWRRLADDPSEGADAGTD